MALVEFEKWLDDKIAFFKVKGTVVFGSDRTREATSDVEYGDFEMAHESPYHRTDLHDDSDFSIEEPEYEFDESDLKGSDYYKFVWNEDDDEDVEVFDRLSHVSFSRTADLDEVASDDDGPSTPADATNDLSCDASPRDGAVELASWNIVQERSHNPDVRYLKQDIRPEGDGQSYLGSLTELALRHQQGRGPEGSQTDVYPGSLAELRQGPSVDDSQSDFTLAQVSDDNSLDIDRHSKQQNGISTHRQGTSTLPMDSTYLSMDEDDHDDDDDMLRDVRFDNYDDYEGTQVPGDTRPIMVEEGRLRALYADRKRHLKKAMIIGAIFLFILLFGIVVFLIWKLIGKR